MTLKPFRSRIRAALADENLQSALDANAESRLQACTTAFSSLPADLETLRQQAHKVRMDVIANLDQNVERFIEKAQSNGMIVHRAADAKEAVRIVLDIAQSQAEKKAQADQGAASPLLIAKSKTMVSEEIELNRALEAAGIKAIETDLGEYIVQLRGEPPSHIITPAVHLRRKDVGQTFHEKLGIPLTDDVPTLTNAARRELRQTFLKTDIGLSGVNLGVIETGTICVVTNEGNGRMVTSLPPVHIALMGIERLVPTFDDLALLMTLLPRAATGQIITVYTQLIQRPRGPEDADGPEQRHLILVDNGRRVLRDSPLAEALCCIRCGACLNACPVFREIGGHAYVGSGNQYTPYPGPIGSVVSPGLFGGSVFGHLAQASSLCGACKEACPVDIDLPTLLLRVRAGEISPPDQIRAGSKDTSSQPNQALGLPWTVKQGLRLFTWAATSPWRFRLAQKFAGIAGSLTTPKSTWMNLPAFTGWGYSKDIPRPASQSFEQWWKTQTRDRQRIQKRQGNHIEKPEAGSIQESTPTQPESQTGESPNPLSIFKTELTNLDGEFTRCTSKELPECIASYLQAREINEIASWSEDNLPEGLLDKLQENGIKIVQQVRPDIRCGLTGATAAVAETGTLLLASGPGRSQLTSLLPEIHLAILNEKDIYENLSQALSLKEVAEASSVALISGPSRTADIEMTLTIGVHGPTEVQVFCLP